MAAALGYTNPRKALADHIDDEDKGVTKCDTLGGTQEMTIINESGLYSLVLSSKLPTAKEFRKYFIYDIALACYTDSVRVNTFLDDMSNFI